MRPSTFAAMLVTLSLLGGCSQKVSNRNLTFVDPPDAATLMEARKGPLGLGGESKRAWVDPRTSSKFSQGHIPGAISLPFAQVANRHRQLRQYDLIIVYGEDYGDPLAEAMSKRLIELKHDDVRTLRGGLKAWTDAGHQLQTSD